MHLPRARCRLLLAATFLVALTPAPPADANPGGARIQGTILSETGEKMPGVLVTLLCGAGPEGKGPTALTDIEGAFVFRLVMPGIDCFVRSEIPGYATVVVGPLRLLPGEIRREEIRLVPPSATTEIIVVKARGAIVETETATTATTLNQEYLGALPVVGRSFQDLLTLAPGVTDVDGDGNPNVRGSRDTGLQYRLDGADITDPLTGHFGQFLNIDAVEEVEIITAGAPAEFSRADGGFANIVTRSGGNEFQGSIRLFFRTRLLDGDGAASDDFFVRTVPDTFEFRDLKGAFTFGGPLARDRLWYFLSVQSMDIQTPTTAGLSASWVVEEKGYQGLAKLTWQVNADNKLSVQANFDPRRLSGLGLDVGVLPESDYMFKTGGIATTLRWTAIISPTVIMETAFSDFDAGQSVDPVSPRFEAIDVATRQAQVGAMFHPVAIYPCDFQNCDRSIGPTNVYQIDLINNTTSGPYWLEYDDTRLRTSVKSTFTVSLDDLAGSHTLKTGFEFKEESYSDIAQLNPILYSSLQPPRGIGGRNTNPGAVGGFQTLSVYAPSRASFDATGGGLDYFVQDVWKPFSNLAISAGVRVDRELVDSFGVEPFPVRGQAKAALRRFDMACSLVGSRCEMLRAPGRPYGTLPSHIPIPAGHPLEKFDLNGDGYFEPGIDQEGVTIWGLYTRPEERQYEQFSLRNTNVAPRFAVSWDPWNDGRTRVSWSWGRYYDRIFLNVASMEQTPDQISYTFLPGAEPTPWIAPGDESRRTSAPSIITVSRDLQTPYKDEWSLAVEREIAPEWSVKLMLYSSRGHRLLQDIDINHITCPDFRHVFGVDSHEVCGAAGTLVLDLFGRLDSFEDDPDFPGANGQPPANSSLPNGVVDLYNVNPNFNQILRIGNYNSSTYRSFEVALNRRLYHGWQAQISYVLSRARGDAEAYLSRLGDDPAFIDDEEGFLDYDQRHVVKVLGTVHLPRSVILGGTVIWASGTPYSVVARMTDLDDVGNATPRQAFITGQRNDQRNGGSWTVNARIQKGFTLGPTSVEAFLSVDNLLDGDDLTLREKNVSSSNSILRGARRTFGRRWELGASIHF
jgi:hypothetical protein